MSTYIGHVINPAGHDYDLESSLRVHQMLVQRATHDKWRFTGPYVTTGPLEALLGYPFCGSSRGGLGGFSLDLRFEDGLSQMVQKVNKHTMQAMCYYPGFASLDEQLPRVFVHAGAAVESFRAYESARTRKRLNSCHAKATFVRDVRMSVCETGVYLDADVAYSRKDSSHWGLFWLASERRPRWNERLRLATWLDKARRELDRLVKPRA